MFVTLTTFYSTYALLYFNFVLRASYTKSDVDSTLFVVHCDLYCENKKEPRSLVYLPSTVPPEPSGLEHGIFSLKEPKYVRNLTGTLTANANHLVDDKKQPGIFFIFHDLSVRTDGWFTLKFMFMDLGAG